MTVCTGLELSDSLGDLIEHCVEIIVDIFVHDAMKPDPKRFNVVLAATVVDPGEGSEMTVPVDLDRELQFRTIEVYDKLVDAVLPTEFVSEHLSVGEPHPENDLGLRKVTSQIAAPLTERSDIEVLSHDATALDGMMHLNAS